jgi:hypothetical protein
VLFTTSSEEMEELLLVVGFTRLGLAVESLVDKEGVE